MKKQFIQYLLLAAFLLNFTYLLSAPVNASYGQAAFDGPFTYTGLTTVTYKYFSSCANDKSNQSTRNTIGIDNSKTVTVTENQVLTYWLHKPVHYNCSKKYPVLVYCPGSGGIIFEHENVNTVRRISTSSEEFQNSPYSAYYRQSVYYGESFWLCSYKDINGNWVGSRTMPGDYSNSNAAFIEQWYDLVYNQGREEYDCFLIYIQPEDEAWWENHSNLNALCIHTMSQSSDICEKYGNDIVTYSGGNYNSGYVADELSPNVFSQLTLQLIDSLSDKYSIDLQRQYLTGFSLGAQFSFDTMCHYPQRFAGAVFSGLPSSDITEKNAKQLTDMNIWTFSGSSDFCNKNFSLSFAEAVDAAKAKFGGRGEARATVCTGGHSGAYLNGNQTYSSGDMFTKGSTEIIDFLFGSVRQDFNVSQAENDRASVKSLSLSAEYSKQLVNGTYDIVLVSEAPLGNFSEHGFIISTSEDAAVGKGTKKVKAEGMVRSAAVSLGGTEYTLNAVDFDAAFIYTYRITDIPSNVSGFNVQAYGITVYGTYYSMPLTIETEVNGDTVLLRVTK